MTDDTDPPPWPDPAWQTPTPPVTPAQPTSWMITRKVTAAAVASGLATITIWVTDSLGLWLHSPAAAALAGLAGAVVAYLIPEKPTDPPGRHTASS